MNSTPRLRSDICSTRANHLVKGLLHRLRSVGQGGVGRTINGALGLPNAVGALVLLALAGTVEAGLTVHDSLNRYSLYGRKRVLIEYGASTSQGGWIGSDSLVTMAANDTIRSTITSGKDVEITNGKTWVWGDVRAARNFGSNTMYNDTIDGRTWVGHKLIVAHKNLFKNEVYVADSLRTDVNQNVFDSMSFSATKSLYGTGEAVAGITWGSKPEAKPYDAWTFPDTTAVTPGSATIKTFWSTPTTGATSYYRWTCETNDDMGSGGTDLVAAHICNVGDTILPPGNYGDLNLWTGSTLYLGEGVYTFNSVTLQPGTAPNPTRLLAVQPNGARTVIMVKGVLSNQASSVKSVIAPERYQLGYGIDSAHFAGGTMLVYSDSPMDLSVDLQIWATVVVPQHQVTVSDRVSLFGQILADSIYIKNAFKGTDGAFIPYFPKPPIVTVSYFSTSATERDLPSDSVYAKFLLTMDHINGIAVKVFFHTIDGTALAGGDYIYKRDSVTIGPTKISDTIRIPIVNDYAWEPTETFRVILDSSRYGSLGSDSVGTGTIYDNDPPPMFKFAKVLDSASEGTPKPVIAVVLNKQQTQTLNVDVVVKGGTATGNGSDFTFHDTTLTFEPGATSVSLGNFTVVDDHRYESTETVIFALRNPVNAKLDTTGSADTVHTQKIIDNDPRPTVKIVDTSVVEGSVRKTVWTQIVLIDSATGAPITSSDSVSAFDIPFVYSTSGRTAKASNTQGDSDYVGIVSKRDTLKAGQYSRNLNIVIRGDVYLENNEFFLVTIDSFSNVARGAKLDTVATFTILDDDARPAIRVMMDSVVEPDIGQTDTLYFPVVLVDSATGVPLTQANSPRTKLKYSWRTNDGTAVTPGDYVAGGPIDRTIAVGVLVDTIKVVVVGDDRYEGREYLTVSIVPVDSIASVSTATHTLSAQGIIIDDETAPYLCTSDITTTEQDVNSTVSVRVFLSNSSTCADSLTSVQAPELAVRFNWGTVQGTAKPNGDYLGVTQSATVDSITRLTVSKTLPVTIVGDDIHEPTESFTVNLGSLVVGQPGRLVSTVTVFDDDAAPTIASITSLDSLEGNSSSKWWHFKVKMSAKSEEPIVFVWSTVNLGRTDSSNATPGEDYSAVLSDTVSIPVGSDSAFLDVEVKGDTKYEKNELFGIKLTPISGITVPGSVTTATGTIIDDDEAPAILSIAPVALDEGDAGTKIFAFKLKISAPSGLAATFKWSTVAGTSSLDSAKMPEDFVGVTNQTLTIPVGSDSAFLYVTVNGDLKYEKHEFFRVVAVSASGMTSSNGTALGTILNDDTVPTVRILDAPDVTEPANYGAVDTARFKIALSSKTGVPVVVTWATADSSAHSAFKDFVDTGYVVTFLQDVQDTIVVKVPVLGDSLDEPTEVFKAIISSATNVSRVRDTAYARILDNDDAPAIHVKPATVSEPVSSSTAVSVLVQIDRPSALPITFHWSTRDSTAQYGTGDYDSTFGIATIPAGATSVPLSVLVNSDAVANEFREEFRVALSQVVNASGYDTTGVVTIVDRPDLPHITIGSAGSVVEDPTWLAFPVELDRVSAVAVRVRWHSVGITAVAGSDFADTSDILTIPVGKLRDTVRVRVLEDALYEPIPETLMVVLTEPESLVITKDRDRGVIIDDNDAPPVVIDSAQPVTEGGTALVPVSLLSESSDTVFVWWHTIDSTAKAPDDYLASSGVLVFLPGKMKLSVPVMTIIDSIWEPTETFIVRIDSVKGGFLRDSSEAGRRGMATLLEEGDPPMASFDMNDTAVVERLAGVVPVKIKLSRPASIPLRLMLTVESESKATRGVDYELDRLLGDTLEFPALTHGATFDVRVIDDSLDEFDELVRLALAKLDIPALLGKTSWDLTIIDDDSAPSIRFDVDSQKVLESVGKVTVSATLERPSSKEIDVWFSVSGTATAGGVDHNLKPFHLHFVPGALSATVVFDVVDDVIDELDETVMVTLDSARNGNLQQPTRQIVLILDNDNEPTARFLDTLKVVRENVGTVSFPIQLDHPSFQDVVLRISVRGSAILDSLRKGSDAILDSDVVYEVRIPAGDTMGTFEIRVIDDGRVESTEDVVLAMTGGVGADKSFQARSRLQILDNDAYPDVKITRPADSLRTKEPKQVISWTWDGKAQPDKDTVLVEGWNRISRCATDTAGNTGCDTVHVWGDFTPPRVVITKPDSIFLTNNKVVRVCWTVIDSGATWRRVDSSRCLDTTLTEGTHTVVREACDSVGNCGRDQVIITVDLTPPTGKFIHPPDSSHVRVIDQPARIRWIDDKDTIWVDTTLHMRNYGWNTFTATYKDKAGNEGTTSVHVYYEAPTVESGYYLDTDGDGKVDAVVVEFDSPWESDTLPSFTFKLGSETREVEPQKVAWKSSGPIGTPAVDSKGKVVVEYGDTVYLAPGTIMTDKNGKVIVDSATGKPITSPTGEVYRDASGKVVYDAQGREMYRVPSPSTLAKAVPAKDANGKVVVVNGDTVFIAPGIVKTDKDGKPVIDPSTGKPVTVPVGDVYRDASGKIVYDSQGRQMYVVSNPKAADRTVMVVPIGVPFKYGVTSVSPSDSGTMKVVFGVVDATGNVVPTAFKDRFPLIDSVAPIIAKAVVVRTESYTGKDSVFLTPSEPIRFDSAGTWVEVKIDGKWHVVPAESLTVLDDGRIVILVEPGEDGSVRPGLEVRFGTGVSDTIGNVSVPSKTKWATKVEGDPRPPLLEMKLPDPVKAVPASEKSVNRDGGFVIRATDKGDSSGFQWWKPGQGYTNGSDPEIRSVCPDVSYCTGLQLYVNRPVRMILFIYDLSSTYVIKKEVEITQKDIDNLRADKLDRVRIEIRWNMRGENGIIVGSGIYLWRVVSYVKDSKSNKAFMTNQVVKLGIKSSLD